MKLVGQSPRKVFAVRKVLERGITEDTVRTLGNMWISERTQTTYYPDELHSTYEEAAKHARALRDAEIKYAKEKIVAIEKWIGHLSSMKFGQE